MSKFSDMWPQETFVFLKAMRHKVLSPFIRPTISWSAVIEPCWSFLLVLLRSSGKIMNCAYAEKKF